MKLVIDIDGVLADFPGAVVKLLNLLTGKNVLLLGDPVEWFFLENLGFKPDEIRAAALYQEQYPQWYTTVPPLPGALDAVKRLNRIVFLQHGVEVYFITARAASGAKRATEAWLEGLGMRNPTVITAPKGEKGLIIAGLRPDVVVDDYPPNLEAPWLEGYTEARSYLVKHRYNEHAWETPGFIPVDGIGEMLAREFPTEQEGIGANRARVRQIGAAEQLLGPTNRAA